MSRRRSSFAGLVRRFLAAANASLVLALAVFASSPGLHGELHDAVQAGHDDACAVALFASGVALPIATIVAQPLQIDSATSLHSRDTKMSVALVRFLHPPERGPPAGSN